LPIEIFSVILEEHETAFILESLEGPRRLTRYTFLGFEPQATIRISQKRAEILDRRKSDRRLTRCDRPLELLSQYQDRTRPNRCSDRYNGGLVGYASYDLSKYFEEIHRKKAGANEFPDLEFGLFDDGIVFDHLKRKACYFHSGENRIDKVNSVLQEPPVEHSVSFGKPRSNITQENFCNRVERAKEYIESGEIFQTVISKKYAVPFRGSLLPFYKALRTINPSPYMYYLKFGRREIVGSSPEMLARKVGRRIETFPIAGTRPFTADASRNRALASELLQDEKERAEHVMLVDLARNDLGRVSDYGTVQVPELMKVQAYSHIQHIVSRVVGRIRRGLSSFDLFKAVFPAGTVTGAPKVRAMELIEELEPSSRGPYAGAVGYFASNGNADFAITIRTLCAQDDRCYIQSGSGIVADSVPEQEWNESERKAAALFTAMDLAQAAHR
jgi:anthranilate synthase component I